MSKERKKEVGKFMVTGFAATIIDYSILNICVGIFQLPLVVANSISGSVSSYTSYKFNKNVVFEDRMHGRRKTLLLYGAILAIGILVIQNAILHFANGTFADTVAHLIKPAFEIAGLSMLSEDTLALNISKLFASLFSAFWNYFMLRRFVFVTSV